MKSTRFYVYRIPFLGRLKSMLILNSRLTVKEDKLYFVRKGYSTISANKVHSHVMSLASTKPRQRFLS